MKKNLPVMIIKTNVLLPFFDIKLELDNSNKDIIDTSMMFHHNRVLVIIPNDIKEENILTSDLPKIGVIAKISDYIELPDKKIRFKLTGITRARVFNY